jgi:hypothetical protein
VKDFGGMLLRLVRGPRICIKNKGETRSWISTTRTLEKRCVRTRQRGLVSAQNSILFLSAGAPFDDPFLVVKHVARLTVFGLVAGSIIYN